MNPTLKLSATIALLLLLAIGSATAKVFDVRQSGATDAAQPVTENTPIYRDILIKNLTASGPKSAGYIVGLPEMCISNVVFENVTLATKTGLTIRNAQGIQFKNSTVTVQDGAAFTAENATVTGLATAKK